MHIESNQHFLHVLIERAGGYLLIGCREMESAKREKGAIGVERLSSGVFKLTTLNPDGHRQERQVDIEEQIQVEINKLAWPDEKAVKQGEQKSKGDCSKCL